MLRLWAERSLEPERMDVEPLDPHTTASILSSLEKVNIWLGGVRATLFHIQRFSRNWKPRERLRFIDWGTGGADLPRALVRWGRKQGFSFEVVGVDNNPSVIDYARKVCRDYPEITIVQKDFLDVIPADAALHYDSAGRPPESKWWTGIQDWTPVFTGVTSYKFDYAISSLCLHHLDDQAVIALLQQSDRLARRGLIMNELLRDPRAWAWIWTLSRLARAHPIVRHDAPLSVRRAFTVGELNQLALRAGLPYLDVLKHYGYRLTLAGEKIAWVNGRIGLSAKRLNPKFYPIPTTPRPAVTVPYV